MNNKSKFLAVAVVLCFTAFHALPSAAQPYEVYCQDGIDNDGDGRIDTNPAGTPPGNLGPDSDCQCFDDVVPGSFQCTANDIGFVIVGLGTQTDGCVNAADTVGIQLGATLATTGNNRYDIGMWVALDGGNARTGKCARQFLVPPITFGSTPTAAQLNSGDGPFRNQENNSCGDLDKFDDPDGTASFNARYNFKDLNTGPGYGTLPVYNLLCSNAANGVLNISTCIGYDQNSTSTSCSNLNQAVPGTSSKCRCQGPPSFQSNIPVPNVALQCGPCTAVNGVVSCEVTYTNTGLGTCTQTSNVAETEFACGTARYLRFRTTYPSSVGSITASNTCTPFTSGTTIANCNGGPGRGTISDTGTSLLWTPRSDNGLGTGTLGWIGANESGRMRFTFTQTSPAVSLSFPTVAEWADDASFTGAVVQSVLSCSVNVTTPVTLQSFAAERDEDDLVLSWETATESGNAGFNVFAETSDGTRQINARPIPARGIDSLVPQRYSLRVPAVGLERARFFVEDVSTKGETRRHGPFKVGALHGAPAELEPTDWGAIRAEHEETTARRVARERGQAAGRLGSPGAVQSEAGGKPSPPAVQIHVDRSGIQRVTYEALAAAGADYDRVKTTDFVLTNLGHEVPIHVTGGRFFGPGSSIEFVGEAIDTLYTKTNVYSLRVDRRGSRATVDTTAPAAGTPAATYYLDTVRVENNSEYSFSAPEDPWFDRYLVSWGAPTQTDLDLSVDHYVAGAAPATVRVGIWGVTDWPQEPDHHLIVQLNGSQLADEHFDGLADHPVAAAVPSGLLGEGANTLTVLQPGDSGVPYDYVALEEYSVTYPRAFVARGDRLSFDSAGGRFVVSGFGAAGIVAYRQDADGSLTRLDGARVTGSGGSYSIELPGRGTAATYHVASAAGVESPALSLARDTSGLTRGAADYLIVSHPDFLGALGPLVQARQARGLSVKVADVRDVYDGFGYGIFDPLAIRDYVAYAAANLGTRYVLVVGGDTYDYFDYSGVGPISFVPSLYARTGPYVHFAPADAMLGDIDGDGIQDVPVGRMPVRTAAELTTAIDRTLAYDSKAYRRTAVFAADGFDAASATSFTAFSDGFLNRLGEDWESERAYIDHDGVGLAKSKLVNALNGGVALTTFIGHSGPNIWSFQGLFRSSDAAALTNGGAPTVVSQYGCWNAYFVSPAYDSLAHAFLLSGDRGAAAVLGATTLTENRSDRLLGEALTPLLAEPGRTIGDAIVAAKQQLAYGYPGLDDIQVGFTVLGDPALVVEP